jgi:hypothetical protein
VGNWGSTYCPPDAEALEVELPPEEFPPCPVVDEAAEELEAFAVPVPAAAAVALLRPLFDVSSLVALALKAPSASATPKFSCGFVLMHPIHLQPFPAAEALDVDDPRDSLSMN